MKRFHPAGSESDLLDLAGEHWQDSTGVQAMQLLLQSEAGRKAVHAALDANDQSAARVAGLLGLIGNRQAINFLGPVVQDGERPYEVRAAAARTLVSSNLGASALLDMAAKGTLPGDIKILAAGLLSRTQDERLRQRADALLPMPVQKDSAPLPPVDQLAAMQGDVERGKALFRDKATCANCHVVGGFGKQVGPDLSEIGDKLSREALLISVLDPSAGISHNYENFICLLDTGQVITGVKVSETDDQLILRTAEAIDRKIDKEQIEELKKSEKSIMPENLHHQFDQQGLVDLIEYMSTLKKAAN